MKSHVFCDNILVILLLMIPLETDQDTSCKLSDHHSLTSLPKPVFKHLMLDSVYLNCHTKIIYQQGNNTKQFASSKELHILFICIFICQVQECPTPCRLGEAYNIKNNKKQC